MFSYGWQWKGNNTKNVTGEKLKVQPAQVDFNATGKLQPIKPYYFYDSKYNDGTPVPNIKELDFLKRHVEKTLGIDMSNYDIALNNIYTEGTNLYRHTDIDESNTAKGYPVVVYVLGNEHRVRVDDNGGKAVRGTGQMVNPKTLTLNNGDIYTFGMDGKGRFEAVHDVVKAPKTDSSFPPITLPNGKVINNYTVTFTFRRAADLKPEMPSTPAKLNVQPQAETADFLEETDRENVVSFNDVNADFDFYKAMVKSHPDVIFITNPAVTDIQTKFEKPETNQAKFAKLAGEMSITIPTDLRPGDNMKTFPAEKYNDYKAMVERKIADIKTAMQNQPVAFSKAGYGNAYSMPQELFVYLSKRLFEEFGYINPGSAMDNELNNQDINDTEILESLGFETDPFKC